VLLFGNGNGTFQSPMIYPVGQSYTVCFRYFNNDNKLDIAFANYGIHRWCAIWQWEWNLSAMMSYAVGQSPSSVVSGDFNNDNALDLAVTNYNENTANVLLSDGNKKFHITMTYMVAAPHAL